MQKEFDLAYEIASKMEQSSERKNFYGDNMKVIHSLIN